MNMVTEHLDAADVAASKAQGALRAAQTAESPGHLRLALLDAARASIEQAACLMEAAYAVEVP